MSRSKKPVVKVGFKVSFDYLGRQLTGIIARLDRCQAFILGEDRRSYQILRERLQAPHVPPEPPPSPPTDFVSSPEPALSPQTLRADQEVVFPCRGRMMKGRIARLNPKRALVVCDNGEEYAVPYALLRREATVEDTNEAVRSDAELAEVASLAIKLLKEHGLTAWRFDFDHAPRRAGSCQYHRRRITMSLQFARQAGDEEILDTLLHEIAHALVGKQHNHDSVWRAKAREIGSSGERCHDRRFTPPRYIVYCRNGCWNATAERRRRHVVCRRCQGEIVYQTYTEQRWQQLKSEI